MYLSPSKQASLRESTVEEEDRTLAALVNAYRDASLETRRISVISLVPYLKLYGKLIAWEFSAFISFVVLLPINAFIWTMNKITIKKIPYLGQKIYRYSLAPFRGIWAADISALQIFQSRHITALYCYLHIQSVLGKLEERIRVDQLTALTNRSDEKTLKMIEHREKIVSAIGAISKKTIKPSFLVALGPITTVLSWGLGKIWEAAAEYAEPYLSTMKYFFVPQPAPGGDASMADIAVLANLVLMIAIYFGWIFASCFIDKRSIFRSLQIKRLETDFAKVWNIEIEREIPWDIIFIVFALLTSLFVPLVLWQMETPIGGKSSDLEPSILSMALNGLFSTALVIVLFIRRRIVG